MSEPVTQEHSDAEAAPEAAPNSPAPPWGDDFDPARAWDKIQKANSEAKNLREKLQQANRSQLTDEQRQRLNEYDVLVEASKTDQQRKDEALEAASRERDQFRTEALRLRVALKHGISADDFDLLGSGDEDQIEARAQRIAEKNKAVADAMQALTAPPPGAPTPRRPGEQLKPGATPPSAPPLVEQDYPAEWLSPSQRARLQQEREQFQ